MSNNRKERIKESVQLTQNSNETSISITASNLANLLPEHIHRMSRDDLATLQGMRGYGSQWGVIVLPQEMRTRNMRDGDCAFNFMRSLKKVATSEEELQLGVTTAIRMFLLSVSVASKISQRRNMCVLSPTSAFGKLRSHWIKSIKIALSRPARKDGKLLARLNQSDFQKKRSYTELIRFNNFCQRELWDDGIEVLEVNETHGKTFFGKSRIFKQPINYDPWRPLPDDLVHAAGQKSSWIITHLAPIVLDVLEGAINVWKGTRTQRQWSTQKFLQNTTWKNSEGEILSSLPFELTNIEWPPKHWSGLLEVVRLVQQAHFFIVCLSAGPRSSEILSFNTDCLIEAPDGIALVQGKTYKIVEPVAGVVRDWPMPRMAVIAIHNQIRLSKLVSLIVERRKKDKDTPSPWVKIKWKTIQSHLSKLNKSTGKASLEIGLSKNAFYNWQRTETANIDNVLAFAETFDIPPQLLVAEKAVADFISALSNNASHTATIDVAPLWRQLWSKGPVIGNALSRSQNEELRYFIETLNLQSLLDDQSFVVHRFRKTIGRLVALCYAHAPQIMMDIYGHKDIDMTLHYILENSDLLAEIEAVRREINLMTATQAIENVNAYGGKGAKRLQDAISQVKFGEKDFGVKDTQEMAALLTMEGRSWEYVRTHILCMKSPNDTAPCAKGKSIANKAKCQKGCNHRLLEPELMREYDEAITDCITYLQEAWNDQNIFLAQMWSGQILNKIDEFTALHEKWKLHPVIAQVLTQAGRNEDNAVAA